ncbi:lysophospholipid acyltransferase family protein [Desulfonatronovibrio magnus]|uniref:lysophospholipid acyltransferase family protein n=1 Tax=Desulfonatronovibrio magnus TaxID=698827 RepID=UPI0005EB78E9|nr:lysophospholipid acyltransferase family protein [Desulfonatronovibrio magnus]
MSSSVISYEDSYVTNPAKSSEIFHILPTPYFYLRMLGTVFRSARKAKKKQFTGEDWVDSSLSILKHLEKVDCRFFVNGKKNFIDLKEPCVFVANHMSTLETFVLGGIIRPHRKVTFVIKDSLVRYPVFKHVMISRQPIVVTRKTPKQDFKTVMEQGQEKLSQGTSIVVFPQTSRTTKLDPEKFNSIGVKLARKAGVPLIPLALKTDAWSTGWPLKDFGRIRPKRFIHFCFGQPMKVEGNGKEEHQQVVDFIQDKLEKWKKLEE